MEFYQFEMAPTLEGTEKRLVSSDGDEDLLHRVDVSIAQFAVHFGECVHLWD